MRKLIQVLLFLHCFQMLNAQTGKPDISFGSVKPEDFTPVNYSIDTSAAAVYLFDVGSVYYHEDGSAHYEEVYIKHTRIRILNRSAFGLASLVIPLFDINEDEEKIENLQAATYNFSDGKMTVQVVDKNAIYRKKQAAEGD